MVQQVADRHRLRGAGQLGQEVPHRLVVTELAVPGEQHHGHGGELFRDGREAVIGLRRSGDATLEVRHPVGASQYDAPVRDHHDARARHRGPAVGREERIDELQVVSRHAGLACGRTRGTQDER